MAPDEKPERRATTMSLPFTAVAFFEVFARYNLATWPLVVALWVAAAGALVAVARAPGEGAGRLASAVLAVLWLWGGLVYHATYFTSINPAAWGFAALFVAEAGLLGWYGVVQRRLTLGTAAGLSWWLGAGLGTYALAYPALNLVAGHTYPALPSFGVPCPTGIFTVGLLLTTANRPPVAVIVVPALWALIGGSAALVLGVATDYVLLACSALVVIDAARKPRARKSVRLELTLPGYWR
jgi:hypothetical protein